jgi:hypothetical protein
LIDSYDKRGLVPCTRRGLERLDESARTGPTDVVVEEDDPADFPVSDARKKCRRGLGATHPHE